MDDSKTMNAMRSTESRVPLARLSMLPWMLFLAALSVAGYFAWQINDPKKNGDAIATSLVAFENQNKLVIFRAELAPVSTSNDSRMFGLLNSQQVAVIPASVEYSLNLSKVGKDRFSWNQETQTMSLKMPQIIIEQPNLDEARAKYLRDGAWITNDAQAKLTTDNTRKAQKMAMDAAKSAPLMSLARNAAILAVRNNIELPLRAAGYTKAKVEVTFD